MGEIIFITGTDTGVGKTVLTALLLTHLRRRKIHALAMKPFCSGGRADVRALQQLQPGELSDAEMNPFYFDEPVSPYVGAQKSGIEIRPEEVIAKITRIKSRCDFLLVEGAGGVMVPLGKNFLMRNLIQQLRAKVLLVSRDRLGTLNHTMLSVLALQSIQIKRLKVILMSQETKDVSAKSNRNTLQELIEPTNVFLLPFLGKRPTRQCAIQEDQKYIKKTLAAILEGV